MAVNVKMGVDTSGFKSNIQDMTQQLKSFDAQLKYAEATMKATGSAEQGMLTKTNALTGKLETQKRMIQQYTQQLEKMRANGIDPMSKEYQKLQTALLNTSASMVETEAALNGLDKSQTQAATSADKLANSVNGISKKVSLDQVISGVNAITDGLQRAAQKAVELGEQLWNTILDSASRADDTATMAQIYGIDIETYQKMQKLVAGGMDTTVETMLAAQDKLMRGIGKDSKEVMDVLRELNLLTVQTSKYGNVELIPQDSVAMFWQAGQAILAMSDAYDKEAAATALFGKSWKELKPLFETYGSLEEYNKARDEQIVNDEQTIRDLAALNDAVGALESSWTTLKDEMLGAIAPALTQGADAVRGLLDSLTEYLKTDAGQEMMANLGNAVSGLFDDLKNIDPEKVVENFVSLFEKVVGSFEWLTLHWNDVKIALAGIAGGFALLKISTLALNIGKAIDGFKGLFASGGGEAATAGASSGGGSMSAWFSGMLEKFAGGMAVNSVFQLGQRVMDNLDSYIAGLSAEAAQKKIFMHDLNLSESEYYGLMQGIQDSRDAKNVNPDVSGIVEVIASGVQEGVSVGLEDVDISTLLNAEDGEEQIQRQVGVVEIPAKLSVTGIYSSGGGSPMYTFDEIGAGMSRIMKGLGFANGLAYVPRNGLYMLHAGETVAPAREVERFNRTYSSNLYVESMYMNNGQDAEGLAARMAFEQQRTSNGYGS